MKKRILSLMVVLLMVVGLTACGEKALYSKDNPVTVTIWHYYVSTLQNKFEEEVSKFNNTVGKEKGIIVDAIQVSNIDILTEKIVAASQEEVGADPLPDIILAYSSTVLDLDKMGLIADLTPYFTQAEIEKYNPSYIEEGKIGTDKVLKNFPVAKSSEIIFIEKVAYDQFKEAVNSSENYRNVSDEMLKTFEGIMELSDIYYQWTDDLTPDIPNDGKAFFGMDATPNYISVGARQLSKEAPITVQEDGTPIFTLDQETAKQLWEYYMKGIVTGRFAEIGWYRADDMKTGDVISYLGSTGGATYFPLEIENGQGIYETCLMVSPYPVFENKEEITIQQGAGMAVIKTEERRQQAASEFLKWFTQPSQNVEYASISGYSPVMRLEYTNSLLEEELKKLEDSKETLSLNIAMVLRLAAEQMDSYQLTVDKEFKGSYDIRNMLGESLSAMAKEAKKQYQAALEQGVLREEAYRICINEEAFEKWYTQIQEEFQSLTKE